MSYAVGIDLGTTNSVISLWRKGALETIEIDGRDAMPSVVSFRPDGKVLIGQAAKGTLLADPDNTFGSTKREIGTSKSYDARGKRLSPTDIAALVLERLVKVASEATGVAIKEAVITVPAYFNEEQKAETRRAGERAGLRVLRLLPEPTAAAIAYGLDKDRDQTIMVYDLGGGTFDVSILTIKQNNFTVRAVGGDSRLGGDDFDFAIVSWLCGKIKAKTGQDILGDKSPKARLALQKLKEECEKAKLELSTANSAEIIVTDVLGNSVDEVLTLTDYNTLIAPLLQRTVVCVRNTLKDAGLTSEDINRVILVGGSTKNRAVKELVAKEIKPPYSAEKVDLAVSHGAAIVAANTALPVPGNTEQKGLPPIEFADVTAHTLSVDMFNEAGTLICVPIINRQSRIPCRGSTLGFTRRPYQDIVAFEVYRGEDTVPEKNTKLGELELPLTQPFELEKPIACLFTLDHDGLLHFTAAEFPSDPSNRHLIDALLPDETLDLKRVDELVRAGIVKTKTIAIRTT